MIASSVLRDSLTQSVCTFHMFGHLRVRSPHELVRVTTRPEDFDEIDKLMHSTEAAVSSDCCSVLELNFNIPNLALLLIKATVDLLEPFIHLLLHLTKLRCNEITLTEKLLSYSLIVTVECSAQYRKTLIDISKRRILFRRWGSSTLPSQLAHYHKGACEFVLHL